MRLGWKELMKNKMRFMILSSIVFLVSLLTFMISGLANGLSQDNAALIKNLPEGTFYMEEEAEDTYNLSSIENDIQQEILDQHEEAVAFSIQMGFLNSEQDKQHSVAFVTATDSAEFPHINNGEVILDQSLQDDGITIGDHFSNHQFDGELKVVDFVEESKFSHAPVAYISIDDYQAMYQTEQFQLLFLPEQAADSHETLQAYNQTDLLNTIPSYSAEQLSLNMIIGFLIVISGLLFGIFFYMMHVQKIGLYGILKAVGVKTTTLFQMIWTQMFVITISSLALSIALSQLVNVLAPSGMPFHLTWLTTGQLSLVFLVIGFLGATVSGIQIKQVEPLKAIQQGEN